MIIEHLFTIMMLIQQINISLLDIRNLRNKHQDYKIVIYKQEAYSGKYTNVFHKLITSCYLYSNVGKLLLTKYITITIC